MQIDQVSLLKSGMAHFPCPDYLSEPAQAVWRAAIATLAERGTLDAATAPIIERYACIYGRWREAETRLATEGVVQPARRSGVPSISPWLSISRTAAAQLARMEQELGLSPARRGKVTRATTPLMPDGTAAPSTALELEAWSGK